jgi:hypothetical protein
MGIREHRQARRNSKGISSKQARHNLNKLRLYLVNVWHVPYDIAAQVANEAMAGFDYRYNALSISWAECKAFDMVRMNKG